MARTSYISMRQLQTNTLSCIFIVLAYWDW